jgi:tetratricopeptide (TPR) repeat protein
MTEVNEYEELGRMTAAAEGQGKDPAQNDYDTGKKYFEAGDLGQAAAAFHNALIGFEEVGDEKGIANAVNQLGDICLASDKVVQGLDHFQRAYEICDKLDDPFSKLSLKKKMAHASFCIKEYDRAAAIYLEMLDVYRDNNNPQGAVETLDKLSTLYLEKGEREKAADACRTAAAIHKNFKHSREAEALLEKARSIVEGQE